MATNPKSKKVKGALPCGNPERIESSDVIQMTKKRKALSSADAETESEKHIKTLVKNQVNVDTSMLEQFSRHRAFTVASSHDPEADKLFGIHDLKQHRHVNELDSRMEHFRHCGLTENEIALILKKENDRANTETSRGYGPDPSMEKRQMEEIEKKIRQKDGELKKPDTFKGALELSRQSMDLEKAMTLQKVQSGKNVILPPMMIRKKVHSSFANPDDPINHIPDMMNKITPKPEREPRRDRRRRRKLHRQMLRQQLYMEDEEKRGGSSPERDDNEIEETSRLDNPTQSLISTSDVRNQIEKCVVNNLDLHHSVEAQEGCQDFKCPRVPDLHPVSQNLSTQTNMDDESSKHRCNSSKLKSGGNELNEMTMDVAFIPEEEIVKNRLSLAEIMSMEKFSGYQAGEPNKIIYVKNLPNDIQKEDLVSLFGRYQTNDDQRIVFRLLTGRMKGQAFITFPNSSTATQAIDLLNGYKLRDKPMILTYGKRKD